MSTLTNIFERYEDHLFLKADNFDEAVIGVDEASMRLIYSVRKCLEILLTDMDEDDAQEYFNFNVRGAYMGEQTPIWCEDTF